MHDDEPIDTRVARIHELMGDGSDVRSWDGPVGRVHLVTRPDDVKEAYHRTHFVRPEFAMQLGGRGLIFNDGMLWREHRRIAQPYFHERVMDRYVLAVEGTVRGFTERLGVFADSGEPFDLIEETIRFTIRTLYTAIFGVDLEPDHATGELMTRYFDAVGEVSLSVVMPGQPIPSEALARLGEVRREIESEIQRFIEVRRTSATESDDLIGAFSRELPPEDLTEEILSFFLAGGETTSNLLTWLFLLLDAAPSEREGVEDELDSVLGDGPIEHSMLAALPHMQSVVGEAMRLFPPVWVTSRQATCDTTLNGREISAKDWILVCIYLVHRNPNLWDDPHAFLPRRFREQPAGPERYAFVPFGGGRHLCIGKHFAALESMFAAAMALRSFRFERADNSPLSPWPGLTLKPQGRVPMLVHRR